jgi:hypothetical protein
MLEYIAISQIKKMEPLIKENRLNQFYLFKNKTKKNNLSFSFIQLSLTKDSILRLTLSKNPM